MEEIAASKTWKTIDRSIKTLDIATMEEEHTAVPVTFVGIVDQVVQIYNGIKPLIAVLSTLPLLPQAWRAAVAVFSSKLDALAVGLPAFKAGKDL
jgi:hypothetical protein